MAGEEFGPVVLDAVNSDGSSRSAPSRLAPSVALDQSHLHPGGSVMSPALIAMADRLREIFLMNFRLAGGCEEYAARAVQWHILADPQLFSAMADLTPEEEDDLWRVLFRKLAARQALPS